MVANYQVNQHIYSGQQLATINQLNGYNNNNNNNNNYITSTVRGAPSTRVGQTHSPATMQSSLTNYQMEWNLRAIL